MDASQYKDYVLVLLFVKYVSDKYAGQSFAPITIPKGASFADMVALKGSSNIGDDINKKILGPLAKANNLSDMPDFNDPAKLGDGKEKVDRLTNLISIFENPALDFSRNRADGDDLLGDAYEFLMRHFATESGKSKGQFYTPSEVSRVIAAILGIRNAKTSNQTTAYDPTCGSASLLLKIGEEARHGNKNVTITLCGQEKDSSTAGLARMNMILHDYATAEIKQGNTLANPLFLDGDSLKTFDYVVANPPFSDKRWNTGLHPNEGGKSGGDGQQSAKDYGRFAGYGVPPAKQGDYAYLLHILRSIKPGGKGACILPHGVLFRGNAEAAIRKNLILHGYLKGIIGLPANLFYGTGIPACIILLDKENTAARKGIFMIDASKGFLKDGNKNRLRAQDIHKIVDTFTRQVEIPRYSRMVPVAEISDPKNDFNLNIPRYIDSTEPEDLQDIDGHLRGGIPERDIEALERYWQVIPAVRATLFKKSKHSGYFELVTGDVKSAIFGHQEFTAFKTGVNKLFAKWAGKAKPQLCAFVKNGRPKALIETLSEDLLATFAKAPLLDHYDIYQHLLDYWESTMQDDCYLIADEGWVEAAKPKLILDDKNKKLKEKPDFTVGRKKYKTELIPSALVIARYFAKEQEDIEKLESNIAALQQQIEELAEEHGGEGGLLEDAKNEKDKITKASVTARLKEILPGNAKPQLGSGKRKVEKEGKDAELGLSDPGVAHLGTPRPTSAPEEERAELGLGDPGEEEEASVLNQWLELSEKESDANISVRTAQDKLMEQVADKYSALDEDEIKTLVVDDKWIATLAAAVQGELDRVSQTLTGRIRELAERYATPLPLMTEKVAELEAKVNGHIKKMGFKA
jgi:type I restriction enzyme M protein